MSILFNNQSIQQRCFNNLFFVVILSLLVSPTNTQYTKNCHYSCVYCGSPYYSHCIICQQPFKLSPIKNADNIKQYYNTLEEQPWGPCIGLLPQTNTLGIILVIINIITLIYFRNRTIFYIISSLQTLSLFSFIQTAYTYPISYILQSLQYFMFVTSLNRSFKQIKMQIFDDTRYRMWEFLNTYSFEQNFTLVFVLSIICFGIALIVLIARYFSKRQSSIWSICNCLKLQKIFTYLQIGSLITFFFLIQQSILIIAIGIFLDDNFQQKSANIIMVIVYLLILTLMIVNLCMKNLQLFTNKIGQQIQILKKIITPIFIILPINAIIALTVFVLVLEILAIVFGRLTSKQYKRSYFHQCLIKRQMKYRVIQLIVIAIIIVYYLVQTQVRSYQASSAVGIVAVIIISLYIFCTILQSSIQLYGKFYLKQTQQLYQRSGFQLSSLRRSKMVEQTIQNFQTTDQGIMDMVFFGRNHNLQQGSNNNFRQQKKKQYKKRSNIHLTLDQLNQSLQNNGNVDENHLQKFTPSVSPKHNRELQKHLKSKTSRTPKNDRTSRFKLNKVFEPQGQYEKKDMQNISMPKMSMTRQQNDIQNNTKDEDYSGIGYKNVFNGDKTMQSSCHIDTNNNILPKTSNRLKQGEIKTGREINIQIGTQQQQQEYHEQKQQPSPQKSPRFVQQNIQQQQQINDKKLDQKQSRSKKLIKNHILNINNSQQENDDNLQDLQDVNENLNQRLNSKQGQQQVEIKQNNETKRFKSVRNDKINKSVNNDKNKNSSIQPKHK